MGFDGYKELVITEQIPGLIKTHNVTNILHSQGYWASYNIPYDQVAHYSFLASLLITAGNIQHKWLRVTEPWKRI